MRQNNPPPSSVITEVQGKKPARQSGIELLRIISMLFVVLMHINSFEFLNPCNQELASNQPLFTSFRFLLESIVIVGVNCFILISGWFGIRANGKGVLKFVFQVAFLYFLVYLALIILGLRPVSISHLLSCFTLGYWFVHSYLILYIISPILNAFIDNSSKKTLATVLFGLLIYQTVYGWIKPVSEPIAMGYSPISFIGLYLLARYLRLYGDKILQWKSTWLVLLIFGCVVINTLCSQVLAMTGHDALIKQLFYYCNPLLIIQAVAVLLLFSRMKFQSRFINWMAGSCFAIYLIHMHPMVRDYFFAKVGEIWSLSDPSIVLGYFVLLIFIIYIVSILVDKFRLLVWDSMFKLYDRR